MTARRRDIYQGDLPSLAVALCQIRTEAWDVDGNFDRLCEGLRTAGLQGAQLAITPECVLHGYGMDNPERLAKAAEPMDGPRVGAVRALARAQGMDIFLGFAERGEDRQVYNACAFITREGEVPWVYRKIHCRPFEAVGQGGFTPGSRFYVAERRYAGDAFRIGAMICFDREIAESARCLRSLGAELIVCPLATDTSDLDRPGAQVDNEMITRCRAAENEVFIVVVNHAGRFNGGSFAVGPYGEPLCQLGAEPEVRTITLPLGAIRQRFHCEPFGWMGWGYRRPQVYARYLAG